VSKTILSALLITSLTATSVGPAFARGLQVEQPGDPSSNVRVAPKDNPQAVAKKKGKSKSKKGLSLPGKKEKTYISVDVKVVDPKTGEIVDASTR